jgi:hypothetical protein
MTTYTATVPASAMHAAASLTVFAASGKDATMSPILAGVAVSVAGGTFLAVSTDRYMIGEYRTELDSDAETFPAALIPSATLAAYAKGAPRTGYVTMTHDDETHTLTLEFNGNTLRGYVIEGNIPPVGRLFSEPQELHGAPRLNPTFLAKLAKVKHPGTGKLDAKNDMWTFERLAGERAPMYLSAEFDNVHKFRALLQPAMPLR